MQTHTWFDLGPNYGVLELHERMTAPGPALELHVVVDSETREAVAWWSTEQGETLGFVEVGVA